MDADRLGSWFRRFAEVECDYLPFYRALCTGLASDAALLDLVLTATPGQWRPTLLLAALHDVVMQHPGDEFSRNYPTVGGSFIDGTDPLPSARGFIQSHRSQIEDLVATRSTQTNEVNRSALWYAVSRVVAAEVGQPIAFVEIGASAGLNLCFDRYTYDFGDGSVRGDVGSAVRVVCALEGSLPLDEPVEIAHRIGLDISPADLADPFERRWLKACIWPEQTDRHARFDAAADHAVADPPIVVADDAVDGLADLVEGCPDDSHIVIANSWVMTYLERERRSAFESIVEMLGADRDLTWVSAEGEGVVDWVPRDPAAASPHTVVGIRRYRGGNRTDERAATCQPHLQWLRWSGVDPPG